jgi:Xaa-Pro aminopeptidase
VGEVGGVEYEIEGLQTFVEVFQEMKSEYSIRRIGRVGSLIFPLIIYEALEKVFPDAEIVEAEKLLYNLRTIKSENEVACMRKAARIMDEAFAGVVDKVEPGWTELDIQAEIEAEILRGGAEDHALSWTPMIPSGPEHSKLCMNRNTLRKVEESEIICLQAGALYEGYNAALNTPLVLGEIPEEIRKAVLAADKAMSAIIEELKPGATSKELNDAGRGVLEKEGFLRYSPYGLVHSIGMLECEPPWLPVDGALTLVEGMTVCIDVFLFGMAWGSFRLEDTLAVRPDAAERFTRFNETFVPQHYGTG